jgi:uncharacterized protein (DUF433 family)
LCFARSTARLTLVERLGFDLGIKSGHRLTVIGKNHLPAVFSQHPEVMSGALVFKGTRVPVQTFFDHLDHGGTLKEFLEWYDGLTREQLEAAEEIRVATTA